MGGYLMKQLAALPLFMAMLTPCVRSYADFEPAFVDYCAMLEHEIQGRKHGFLAGNLTYYVGGFHASWKPVEDETIGLTHPFHHDLRSRGVGLLESELQGTEHTGVGNDYNGWEFYKDTRVLYGSVEVDGKVYQHPKPSSMRWRPDRLICEYKVGGVTLREHKFISNNDVVASIITSSRRVKLLFSGQSFFTRHSIQSRAELRFDQDSNAIVISEGGTVKSRPDPGAIERVGPDVYSDMTTAMSSSRDLGASFTSREDERGVHHYQFSVPCDSAGTVVTWAMDDDEDSAIQKASGLTKSAAESLEAKCGAMNRLLNEQVPWFRCSDERYVQIYYYLWSLYLMYDIKVGEGWEQEHHTQTAVNNFLGIHRYDAAFQIKVGAWTRDKKRFAYGNVLTWKHLTQNDRYREQPDGLRMLSDNKGVSWHSGAYGVETSEHVLGAWQIYEHTADLAFLGACYEGHFRKLFWKRLPNFAMNQFEVAETLEAMARLTGNANDVNHWQAIIRQDPEHIRRMFDDRWEMNDVASYFAGPADGMIMTNGFWAMRSKYFPSEYARPMVEAWALDKEEGFYGLFFPRAMARQSMKKFATKVDHSFGYTPDTAYFMLDGMFRQGLTGIASSLTLNHLENYNYHSDWQIPMAPEAYDRDGKPFGDQYSNFNAGKILLILEGLAGLSYSLPQQQLKIRPGLPRQWEWMEVRLPIDGHWTRIRYTPAGVKVNGSPVPVTIESN